MPAAPTSAPRLQRLPHLLTGTVLVYALAGLAGLDPALAMEAWLGLAAAALSLLARGSSVRWLQHALTGLTVVIAALGVGIALGLTWLSLPTSLQAAPAGDIVLPSALATLSLSLAIFIWRPDGTRALTALRVLLALPMALPVFVLASGVLKAPEQSAWQQVTELPFSFALAQFGLALAMGVSTRRRLAEHALPFRHATVELLVIVLLASGLLFWRALVVESEQAALDLQRAELNLIGGRLQSSVAAFRRPVMRMAERWDAGSGLSEPAWRVSARSLLRDIPGLVSLQWLDNSGTVRWAEPMPEMQALVGTRPNQDPIRQSLLDNARRSGQAVYSRPIELLQGGLGLLLYAPLQGGEDGMLVAVLRLQPRLENVVALSSENRALAIGYREQIAYAGPQYSEAAAVRAGVLRESVGEPMPGWWMATIAPQPSGPLLRLPTLALGFSTGSFLLLHLVLLWWRDGLRRETALAEAGEALAEANRRFAMATKVARIGVWEWRREEGALLWDSACRSLFGAENDDRPPLRIIEDCLDPASKRQLAAAVRHAARTDGVVGVDLAVRRLDGAPIDLHLTARLLRHPHHRAERLLGVAADVTERQRLERLKSAFVSTVSHELRTPLTAISGSLAMLDAGALGELPPTVRTLIAVSRQNTQRLSLLIDDLLDLERLAQGGLQMAMARLDLHGQLSRAAALNLGFAQGLKVRIEAIVGGAPLWVRADPDRLQQVLANLLANAAKFSPAGESVELEALAEDDAVRIEVRDRGSGVPEDFRPRLFSRFSQADGSDSRRHSGTGLGLAICRELVTRMGGTISYAPREGGGSIFWFTLVRAEESDRGE